MKWLTPLFLLLLASTANAVVPEIPGDGVDNGASSGTAGSCPGGHADAVYSTGCDMLAPEPDKDRDGYNSDGSIGAAGVAQKDCDDTNRTIYPGVHRKGACTGSDYQTCQTTGSWNACQTGPLCESTGSGICKYVDCGSGNDSNSGTYASPYLTLGKVSGGSGGSPPASPYTLGAGDVVYVIGTTACTTTFNASIGGFTVPVLFEGASNGTATDKIQVKLYPGATATASVTNGTPFYITGDYYKIHGFTGSTTYSSSVKTSYVHANGATGLEVSNLKVTAAVFHGDYNNGCISTEHSNASNIHHNYFGDCTVSTGTLDNGAGIIWLDDEDIATEGADHQASFNTIYYNAYSNAVNGACWRTKHGVDLGDSGANGHRVNYSTCVNSRYGIAINSSGIRFKRNAVFNDGTGNDLGASYQIIARIWVDGFTTPHEDNIIEDSTFYNMSMLWWQEPSYTSAAEKLTFRNNVVWDNDAAYGLGNDEGIISIDPYGSNAQKTQLETNSSLAINNNCYWNASAVLNFNYYGEAAGGHGPAGAAGSQSYTFANWKANASQDLASFYETPTFDGFYRATATNCLNKGYLRTSEEGFGSAAKGAVMLRGIGK